MDQNWNDGANSNMMPAPNMGAGLNVTPSGETGQPNYAAPQPQMPMQSQSVAPVPNMNVNGGVPVVNQPGIAVAPAPVAQKDGKSALIETIILVVVCLIAASAIVAAVIFFMKYNEISEDVDTKVNAEVAKAVAKEQEASAKKIEEAAKEPRREFRGPTDYGSISFRYPKDWSVYVEMDGSNNSDFKAYFQKDKVAPLSDTNSRYALRFVIYNRQYDDVTRQYASMVKNGKLKSQMFTADGNNISGTRYEGEISSKMNGIFVVFKVNDKTAVIQTDTVISEEIVSEFEKIISSLRRNTN